MNNRLERKIEKAREELRQLIEQKKVDREQRKAARQSKPKGRPRISDKKLKEIEAEAYIKPLPDVAMKFNVSLRSLYNHGITRENLLKKAMQNQTLTAETGL